MSESLGPLNFNSPEQSYPGHELLGNKDYSEHTAEVIDDEVTKLLLSNEERTIEVLNKHRDQLDVIANALLEQESLSDKDISELLSTDETSSLSEAAP